MDYIRQLIATIFAICLMSMLLDCDFKNKRKLYLLGLFEAVMIICNILVLLNFGYPYFMKLYPLLIQTPVLLAFIFVSKFKVIKVLFIHFTIIATTTSITMIGIIISSFFGSDKALVYTVCYLMYLPSAFIFYKYLRPSFLYMLRNADKGWYGFCTIPLSYTVLIYMMSKYSVDAVLFEPTVAIRAILLLILTLSAYILIFRFFRQTREQLTMQNEQNLLRTQIAAAQMHLESLKESQEQTIIYRHDMRHHLNLISAFLADNNTAATKKYIAEVEEAIDSTVVEKYCNNYTVNLILYSYLKKAKEEQIAVETQISLKEKNLVSDMDLCVIFSDAIENAINACMRIPNTKDRALKIICTNKNDKLLIQITNSYEGTIKFVDDLPVSAENTHGFGTKSIAAVAQKYSGVYSFTADNNVFKSYIML